MNEIVKVLMERDGLTRYEAENEVKACREMVYEDGEDPEDVLYEELGLEGDYFFDLLY